MLGNLQISRDDISVQMVHPEGQLYFYQPAYRLVTEAFLFDHLIFVKITFWLERISQLLAAQQMTLPLSSELFLEMEEETTSCKYYFVDHATRRLFWLDGGRTDELDLPQVSSDDHLSKSSSVPRRALISLIDQKSSSRSNIGIT
jgi:hypothetical protein